ncbi:MAG: nickel pincer cofactor biosynthesis protein LarB [Oscillospiraceae bacterium]|jgi:NCAIR mutase (PurE)-related protein
MDVNQLLNAVKNGTTSVEEAAAQLKNLPYEDLGFAKLDHHRSLRSGFPEVIFCQGKTKEQIVTIFEHFIQADAKVLATRASWEQYEAVRAAVPDAVYLETPRLITYQLDHVAKIGKVAVCTAGTSDIPVAEEAACVAEFFGAEAERFYDVGVAGIHRLLAAAPKIREANVVIAIAGMEGALASVIGGLVDKPVIAVPTSVGYGANFGGVSALLTMLNSCAEGISVVNIDNGFGAGYLAAQINRLIEK